MTFYDTLPVALEWLVRLALFGAVCGAVLLHFVMEPVRWRLAYLDRTQGPAQAGRVRDILFCTTVATYIFPFKIGLPLRMGLLNRLAAMNVRFIGTVLAVDGLISLAVWVLAAIVCVWLGAFQWQPPVYVWVGAGVMLTVVVGLGVRRKWASGGSAQWSQALALFRDPWRRMSWAGAILLLDVSLYWLRHALLVLLVTGQMKWALAGGSAGLVATFAGIISGLPMGLLGYDASLLALLGAAGVPIGDIITIITLNRALNIAMAVMLGIPAGIRLGIGTGLVGILRKLKDIGSGKERP
ncbi:lysylphosphatidylglycerol synthase domain-containing protein [Pelomonas sp. APW6]|uniref:Lysylphosphatidylglycerol synthase domain-containing protein n=1 Tax=Roseateles subflavus TaxID=3053353 RepID=A0ABT7LEL9_9BURK|nr:lysylphosphatidylglycerol synthase domain-containing protein [Pelomonas sp. APW6]MDL5030909.1 lysylphosphatidylglycerol synthase domain-containing protein [Pelomonas sp. APW6]